MTQQEVMKVLEKNPDKWMTAKEIAPLAGSNPACIARCLAKMFKFGEVFRKTYETSNHYFIKPKGPYLWKAK